MRRIMVPTILLAAVVTCVACGSAAGDYIDYQLAVLSERAEAQVKAGKLDDALVSAEKAVKIAPKRAEAWRILGQVRRARGEASEAESALRKAIEFEPQNPSLHNDLAVMLRDFGMFSKAIAEHNEALRLNPGCSTFIAAQGVTLFAHGHLDDAAAAFREAIRIVDADYASYAWKSPPPPGDLAALNQAVGELGQTLRLGAELDDYYCHLGLIYAIQGRTGEALGACVEAAKGGGGAPHDPYVLETLGVIPLLLNDLPRAEAALTDAVKTAPLASTRAALAYCYASQGRRAIAEETLAKVNSDLKRRYPGFTLLFFAGMTYEKLGDAPRTAEYFRRAVSLWPQHPWSAQMQRWLDAQDRG